MAVLRVHGNSVYVDLRELAFGDFDFPPVCWTSRIREVWTGRIFTVGSHIPLNWIEAKAPNENVGIPVLWLSWLCLRTKKSYDHKSPKDWGSAQKELIPIWWSWLNLIWHLPRPPPSWLTDEPLAGERSASQSYLSPCLPGLSTPSPSSSPLDSGHWEGRKVG